MEHKTRQKLLNSSLLSAAVISTAIAVGVMIKPCSVHATSCPAGYAPGETLNLSDPKIDYGNKIKAENRYQRTNINLIYKDEKQVTLTIQTTVSEDLNQYFNSTWEMQ